MQSSYLGLQSPSMDHKPAILVCLLLFTLLLSCGESAEATRPINPNGDSELALLMREMADEAEQLKEQIARGQAVTISVAHEEILTAEATEPEKAASAPYEAFATSYLETVNQLRHADADNISERYGEMVENCIVCHQALCPGPLVRINKLQ